jgi:hypothetical protein
MTQGPKFYQLTVDEEDRPVFRTKLKHRKRLERSDLEQHRKATRRAQKKAPVKAGNLRLKNAKTFVAEMMTTIRKDTQK